MGLSKSTRILILLGVDSAFFLLELIVGSAVHSLALVADSFHMLNDVISLCVGLWAVKVANSSSSKMYTYGYQRAETLGALVNGVFLVALCLSIFLEAIQRFVEPQEVSQPKLVLIVGCMGLASNILGLALFHDHGHSHGGHSHGRGDAVSNAEEGHEHEHTESHSHSHAPIVHNDTNDAQSRSISTTPPRNFSRVDEDASTATESASLVRSNSTTSPSRRHNRTPGGSRASFPAVDQIYTHPAEFRDSIIAASRLDDIAASPTSESEDDGVEGDRHGASERSPLLKNKQPTYTDKRSREGRKSVSSVMKHSSHKHRQPKTSSGGGGHGHSHGDLNMRGVFLHVMGDALGNIGVIVTALIIWLTDFSWRFYCDPAISLVITLIILASAIPLCRAASRILLQAVPENMSVDDIQADIEDLEGVVSCHHVHVWQLSDTKLVASLHVQVAFDYNQESGENQESSAQYMKLARDIRTCLHEYGIHSSTIQPEFCLNDNHMHAKAASREGSPGLRDGTKKKGTLSREASIRSLPDACLLDCGNECGAGKGCCAPSKSSRPDDHAH